MQQKNLEGISTFAIVIFLFIILKPYFKLENYKQLIKNFNKKYRIIVLK